VLSDLVFKTAVPVYIVKTAVISLAFIMRKLLMFSNVVSRTANVPYI
jgi:hypothetical protein